MNIYLPIGNLVIFLFLFQTILLNAANSYEISGTISGIFSSNIVVNVYSSTTVPKYAPLNNFQPGLYAGVLPGRGNYLQVNPKTSIVTNLNYNEMIISTSYTTKVYNGYIFDRDGIISFVEDYDNDAGIFIDGRLVLADTSDTLRTHSGKLQLTPGWVPIEIRLSQSQYNSGEMSFPGIGYDPNGGTNYQYFTDPGDASFLATENPNHANLPVPLYNVTANSAGVFSINVASGKEYLIMPQQKNGAVAVPGYYRLIANANSNNLNFSFYPGTLLSGKINADTNVTGSICLSNGVFDQEFPFTSTTYYYLPILNNVDFTIYYKGGFQSTPKSYRFSNPVANLSGVDFIVTSYSIGGTVFDSKKNAFSGANITITSSDKSIVRKALTGLDGKFLLTGLKAGNYEVDAYYGSQSHLSFSDGVQIISNSIFSYDISLNSTQTTEAIYAPRIIKNQPGNSIPIQFEYNTDSQYDLELSLISSDGKLVDFYTLFGIDRPFTHLILYCDDLQEVPTGVYFLITKFISKGETEIFERIIFLSK